MPIVLLSDFGTKDPYVGIMKGVISQIAPKVPVIDLTHEISPFDVEEAAFVLFQAYSYFPAGSIFVTVVDPGVGSACRRILVKTKNYFFVGPDNGYLSLLLSKEKPEHVIHLTHEAYFLNQVSSTFHGRDIFAPVAAQIAEGIDFKDMGPPIYDPFIWEDLIPRRRKKVLEGSILSIDRFGNAITNFPRAWIRENFGSKKFELRVKGKKIHHFFHHYAEAPLRKPFLLFGSSDFLEISLREASLARKLKLKRGDKVLVNVFPS